jgi:outer membrane protein assembly factor BamB
MLRQAQSGLAVVAVLATLAAISGCSPSPAEVHTPASSAYPQRPIVTTGALVPMRSAPLIVDDRLRVFASEHEVSADGPIDAAPVTPPYWSFRRSRVELMSVVATGTTVVSLWCDGELVAIDAPTGRIAWRVPTELALCGYPGRRTGAGAVYFSENLLTAIGDAGRPVVLRTIDGQMWAFDAATGARLWHTVFDGPLPNCRTPGLTTTSGYYLTVDYCGNRGAMEIYDVSTGALVRSWEPPGGEAEIGLFGAGCQTGRSECQAVAIPIAGYMRAWTIGADGPVEALGFAAPDSTIVGTVAVGISDPYGSPIGTEIVGRDLATGRELWRWSPPSGWYLLVAGQANRFHVITRDRDLITIDAMTGVTQSRFSLVIDGEEGAWSTGHVYANNGFVAVERLVGLSDSLAADDDYYFSDRPMLLAAT